MGKNSKIEWLSVIDDNGEKHPGHTFNPWIGCTHKSPGCKFCYAENLMDTRMKKVEWGAKGVRQKTNDKYYKGPIDWNRKASKKGVQELVFCASLADVFDEHPSIDPAWREELWSLVHQCESLSWLLLTKRPENISMFIPESWGTSGWPDNVWLGTSVEDQKRADERIPLLLEHDAVVRFLSCEPLIEKVDLSGRLDGIDWVIVGGESGLKSKIRPMEEDWLLSIIGQCREQNVAVFVKQAGSLLADEMGFSSKRGGDIDEWPKSWRHRHFPIPRLSRNIKS